MKRMKMRRKGRKKVLVMLAAEGMRVQSRRSSTFGSRLLKGGIPESAPLGPLPALSSDRLLSGFVYSTLRARVVEVSGPRLSSSLPECSRAGAQRKCLKRRLRNGPVRTSQMTSKGLLAYIVSARNSSPGFCSNHPFVHPLSPMEVEDALALVELGKPASYLFS